MSVYRAALRVAVPVAAALVVAGISMPAAWANPGPPPGPHPAPHPGPPPPPPGVRLDQCTGGHGRIVYDDPRNTRGPRHCDGGNLNGRRIN